MSSTYSTSLRIQLIDTATEFEAWGQPTDNNLGTVIEQAITGIETISLTNLTTFTLSTANAAPDQARNAVLVFTGAPTGNCNVIAPSVQKIYVVNNKTTGGYNVNIKTSSGNAAVVNANTSQLVFCDGTTFYAGIALARVDGDLTVSGNIKLGGLLNANNGSLVMKANTSVVNMGYNTGAMLVPIGTTAQRPSVGIAGMSRWNADILSYEVYTGSVWIAIPLTSYSVNFLAVAGGGGAGYAGGGGGGGGYLTGTRTFDSGVGYTVTIGAGGSGTVSNGGNSTLSGSGIVTATAIGGGLGGNYSGYSPSGLSAGSSGGSGGGGGEGAGGAAGGSGTSGQGYAGGSGGADSQARSGGGGGAGGAGTNGGWDPDGSYTTGGYGGPGKYYSVNGGTYGAGANGAAPGDGSGSNAPANTGNGGNPGYGFTGSGGSGIVIISYAGSKRGSGGTYTYYAGNSIHTFTSSGTYTA